MTDAFKSSISCGKRRSRCLAWSIRRAATLLPLVLVMPSRGADAIAKAGNAVQLALPATALGLTIGHFDGKGALEFGESAALTIGVTELLKYTVPETRPDGGSHSFPSGHASISFASAEFMRKRYGWEYGLPAYSAAAFVGYSRVEANEHHPRDVVAGAAIGVASSFLFTTHYARHIEL